MKRCKRCVMDESDKDIVFEDGICNYCKKYDEAIKSPFYQNEKLLHKMIKTLKSQNKKYDCLIGVSGGIDSSYLVILAKKWGLNPLLVHVDSGWNSELAISNIEKLVDYSGFDLYTYVIDWNEIRDLQLSFFKAGVPNCDITQDHAFVAAVYKSAIKFNIKYILNGNNIATELVLPKSWGYRYNDLTHIKDIHSKFGKLKLKNYPTMNFFEYNIYFRCIKKIKTLSPLNFIDYKIKQAKKELQEIGYKEYQAKHYESIFTKFFQSYYLVKKFGIDKRKAHLSNLILSNQISRDEAIEILNTPAYDKNSINKDIEFVAKKLNISLKEFNDILNSPAKSHYDYKTNDKLVQFKLKFDKYFKCLDFNRIAI